MGLLSDVQVNSRPAPTVERPLLLASLSVVGFWSLLLVLAAGLYEIVNALESVRTSLEKITMGVRAIAEETRPLGAGLDQLAAGLTTGGEEIGTVAGQVGALSRSLEGLKGEGG